MAVPLTWLGEAVVPCGRTPIFDRPLTNSERVRRSRDNKKLKALAELAEARGMHLVGKGTVAAVRGSGGDEGREGDVTALPELPANAAAQIHVMEAEIKAVLRAAMFNPKASPQARISAARSLGEITGLLRTRTPAPDLRSLEKREPVTVEEIAAREAETRAQRARLDELERVIIQRVEAEAVPQPWD